MSETTKLYVIVFSMNRAHAVEMSTIASLNTDKKRLEIYIYVFDGFYVVEYDMSTQDKKKIQPLFVSYLREKKVKSLIYENENLIDNMK